MLYSLAQKELILAFSDNFGGEKKHETPVVFFLPTKQHQFPGLDGAKIDDCFVIHVQHLNVLGFLKEMDIF